ncbi:hypothetical protein ACLOJK_002045 [Asimina triloba]
MVVGILVMLFCSGRCQGIIAAPCNGTIGSFHAEDELFVDTTEINIYEAVEFVMDSEISRRILAKTVIHYTPLKPGAAKPGAQRGKPYTRPCTFANQCERGTPPRP